MRIWTLPDPDIEGHGFAGESLQNDNSKPELQEKTYNPQGLIADPDLDPTIYLNADQDSDLGFGNTLIVKISTFLRFLFSQSFLSFTYLRFLFSKFNISYLIKITLKVDRISVKMCYF